MSQDSLPELTETIPMLTALESCLPESNLTESVNSPESPFPELVLASKLNQSVPPFTPLPAPENIICDSAAQMVWPCIFLLSYISSRFPPVCHCLSWSLYMSSQPLILTHEGRIKHNNPISLLSVMLWTASARYNLLVLLISTYPIIKMVGWGISRILSWVLTKSYFGFYCFSNFLIFCQPTELIWALLFHKFSTFYPSAYHFILKPVSLPPSRPPFLQ